MDIYTSLSAPFPPDVVSWRIGSMNKDKTKGMALAYIDARDVMNRLDDVVGPGGWQCEYVPMPNGTACCRIGINTGSGWVWKANGAENLTDSEKPDAKEMAIKGTYSDAFKRAAVLWGIGRYLYDLESPWVAVNQFKQIEQHELPRLRKLLAPRTIVTSGIPPKPAKRESNELTESDARYIEQFSAQIQECRSRSDIIAAWRKDLSKRDEMQITHETQAHADLVAACELRIASLAKKAV